MMIYIILNNQKYGPYDDQSLLLYVNNGQVLLCDKAIDANSSFVTSSNNSVSARRNLII